MNTLIAGGKRARRRKFKVLRTAILSMVAAFPATLLAGSFGPLLTPENGTFPEDCCAIHMIHMKGGDFIMWGGYTPDETKSWKWNAFTGAFSSDPIMIGGEVFCCGVSQLADGRPIIAGGDMGEANGITHTFIFNPVTNQWVESGHMTETRWYPTIALLADGTPTAISGWGQEQPVITWRKRVDVYNVAAGTWADFLPSYVGTPEFQPHFYPFMIPYYDAADPTKRKLFFAGRSTVTGQGLGTLNSFSLTFDSNTVATWSPLGGDSIRQGSGAVIMISRTDPIDVGTVYKFGGVFGESVVALGHKIDLNLGPQAFWTSVGQSLARGRAECNVVAMPDGRIAVVGGTDSWESHSEYSTGVNDIEIFNPATGLFDEVSPAFAGTRMYHSTASPTPNATLLMAGGQYIPDNETEVESNFTAQEYYPSYFDVDAIRPMITASRTTASWNTTILVTATGPVDHFSLLKLSSTTHANDTTQRYIKLTEASRTGNNYQLKMPKNGGIAPPGQYMLFAISVHGVPSVAKYIQIGP